jgi:hypothetical protein
VTNQSARPECAGLRVFLQNHWFLLQNMFVLIICFLTGGLLLCVCVWEGRL